MNFKHGQRAKNRGTLVHIGYGNFLNWNRVVAILAPETAPAKRLRAEAVASGRLLIANAGRRTKAVIITDSNHVILAALAATVLRERLVAEAGGSEK
ncbi:MAG: DUF370 domain-containing protein [Deltaproteobacteria bacterium]|nr:DUF370 domain-containing protein [Deltaproteobacteria bacterium]